MPAVASPEPRVRPEAADIVPTPWNRIVRLALAGTVLMAAIVLWHVERLGGNPLSLIQPGADGPSVELITDDFPDVTLPGGVGLDGQQYYAIARHPFDLDGAADHLDRPAYRLQRPLYAWAAWVLHPTGGGLGLVYAFAAVGLLALFGGGVAAGSLSTALGGRTWPALAYPLLPGCYMSLRVSVADAMAVTLALAALSFGVRCRWGPMVALAVAAALTKESVLLVFAGWALARRTKRDAAPLVAAAAVAGIWRVWLSIRLPEGSGSDVGEIVLPLRGVWPAIEHWMSGQDQLGLVATVGAVAAAAVALVCCGMRHPLSWVVAVNAAFLAILHWNVLALDFGGTRSTLPLAAVSLVVLASLGSRADDPAPLTTLRPQTARAPSR